MIHYTLQCAKGHSFEGWFQSSDAFDKQAKKKLVACPKCGSIKVERGLMVPSVVTGRKKDETRARRRAAVAAASAAVREETGAAAAEKTLVADPEQRQILRELKKLRDAVLAKSEYVGPRFAEEARRIHNEETPARGIHGEASVDDVKALVEDGIEVHPIPVLPDDTN